VLSTAQIRVLPPDNWVGKHLPLATFFTSITLINSFVYVLTRQQDDHALSAFPRFLHCHNLEIINSRVQTLLSDLDNAYLLWPRFLRLRYRCIVDTMSIILSAHYPLTSEALSSQSLNYFSSHSPRHAVNPWVWRRRPIHLIQPLPLASTVPQLTKYMKPSGPV
jgi:hypothetical protein